MYDIIFKNKKTINKNSISIKNMNEDHSIY